MIELGQWADALLRYRNLTATPQLLVGIVAWGLAEGDINVPRCSGALCNPLDTEWRMPGSSNFNDAGVQSYGDVRTGIEATWLTLDDGHYSDILAALSSTSTTAEQLASCPSLTTWGTGQFVGTVAHVRAELAACMAVPVPGAVALPDPPPPPKGAFDVFTISSSKAPGIFGCDGRHKWVLTAPQYAAAHAAGVPNVEVENENDDGYPVVPA